MTANADENRTSSSLLGKQVFVTGGSRGIGAAIVELLAQSGAQVAFSYSSNQKLAEELVKKLPKNSSGEGHFCLHLNQSQEESVESACKQVLEKMPKLYGLINNAGITKDQLLLRMKVSDFDQVINTNLRGAFLVTHGLSKHFFKSREGSIVHISSVIGQTGNMGQINYSAAKAGLHGMSKSMALEFAARGVRVNCVAPGFIATEMTQQLTPEIQEGILKKVPLGRMGQGIDVAKAVRFLLSDEASYITGHTLSVNGGLFMD